MLTPEDIKNLTNYQIEAYKNIFAIKEDMKELVDILAVKIDSLTNKVAGYTQELRKKTQNYSQIKLV